MIYIISFYRNQLSNSHCVFPLFLLSPLLFALLISLSPEDLVYYLTKIAVTDECD